MDIFLRNRIPVAMSLILISVSVSFLAYSCSPTTSPPQADQAVSQPKEESRPVAKQGWETEWEQTLNVARKEGKVVVYTSSTGPAIKEAIGLFRQKYGIDIEVVSGRGSEMSRKIITERNSGLYLVDVFNVGMNNNLGEAKPAKMLDPLEGSLILPEVKDPKVWFGGELPWGDKDHMVLKYYAYPSSPLGINTDLSRADEIKSYYDLLAPKWKGRIAMNDPTLAGIGFNSFSSLMYNKALDLDYFRQLIQQQPVIVRDQRLQIDWVAKGKYSIALWPQPGPLSEYREAGAPVSFIPTPKEGAQLSVGGGALSVMNRPAHPNAAKVFINWILSREGQMYMQNAQQLQSTRVDVPFEGIDPLKIRTPGAKYFMAANTVEEWIITEQDRYVEMSKQVFDALLK